MKKIFKALSIVVASTALGAGIAVSSGCSGYNGTYYGEYHYDNWGQYYGMVVEVTVKNNVITEVKDITNTDNEHAIELQAKKDKDGNIVKDSTGKIETNEWHVVSPGWVDYYVANWQAGNPQGSIEPEFNGQYGALSNAEAIDAIPHTWYNWSNDSAANWSDNEAWLLQSFKGKAVADILDIYVFIKDNGEPYEKTDANNVARNAELVESGLLIGGATQGSGRLMRAVQDALSK